MDIPADKYIFQLTVEEFGKVLSHFLSNPISKEEDKPKRIYEYGIGGIARLFDVSLTTANRYKSTGILDKAIKQGCRGGSFTIDTEYAKELWVKAGQRIPEHWNLNNQ